jgi:hypothetical protein
MFIFRSDWKTRITGSNINKKSGLEGDFTLLSPCDKKERDFSLNREFSKPKVMQIAEACGPQGTLEPSGQLVGGFRGSISVRKSLLPNDLAIWC